DEIIPEFWIVAHPVLRKHERKALAVGVGLRNHSDVAHPSTSRLVEAIEERADQSGDLGTGVFLQKMPPGDHVRSFSMWQQLLESRRESWCIEHLVFASPNDQRRQLGFSEFRLKPGETGQCPRVIPERDPAGPSPGQKPSLGVGQGGVIGGKRLAKELVAVN